MAILNSSSGGQGLYRWPFMIVNVHPERATNRVLGVDPRAESD